MWRSSGKGSIEHLLHLDFSFLSIARSNWKLRASSAPCDGLIVNYKGNHVKREISEEGRRSKNQPSW